MFWHYQQRGETTCFSLSCPVLWTNPFRSQSAPLQERKSCALLNSDTACLGKGSSPGMGDGGWDWWNCLSQKEGQVLEEARIKAAESINVPVRQDNFIHMLIVLWKAKTSPSIFWVFQGAADLPKQALVLILRLLKSSGKSFVHFKPWLALT